MPASVAINPVAQLKRGNYLWISAVTGSSELMVITVVDLDYAIERIELHAEELIIHLRSVHRDAPGAEHIRSLLLVMLLRLVALKGKRQRREEKLKLDRAA